jgi:hypothetical protein
MSGVVGAIHSFSSRIAGLPKHLHVLVVRKHSTLVLPDKRILHKKGKWTGPDPMCLPLANPPHRHRHRETNRERPSHRASAGPATTKSVHQHGLHYLLPASNFNKAEGTRKSHKEKSTKHKRSSTNPPQPTQPQILAANCTIGRLIKLTPISM